MKSLLLLLLAVGGCRAPASDAPPSQQALACASNDTPQSDGVLALVNDSRVGLDVLAGPVNDDGVGLTTVVATELMQWRPFDRASELGDLANFNGDSCQKLIDFACSVRDLCVPAVSIGTWNLQQFPRAPGTAVAAADEIAAMGLDIVGIQEVSDVDALLRMAGEMDDHRPLYAEPGPYTRVGLVYDARAVELIDYQTLFADDWYAFPRPVLVATFEVSGIRFKVAVLHLKASGDDESMERRLLAAGSLALWIAQQSEAVVVVGDWNDEITDEGSDNVFAGLIDDPDTEFATWDAAARGDFSYVAYERLIDHVLTNAAARAAMRPQRTVVVHLEEKRADFRDTLSDHIPVYTSFLPR